MEVDIMENKIVIPLNDGKELVAELYNYDGEHPEITVYIRENGLVHQDVCLIRPHEGKDLAQEKDSVDCLVWADENNECFTDEYWINIHEEVKL
jgi:hypothetical protein